MRHVAILLLLAAPLWAWPKRSPFTEVRFDGATPIVRYDGALGELVEIDGLAAADVVAFCRRTYGDKWEKRFAEDLVEVLAGMGRRPGRSVSLVLRRDGRLVPVARAEMTRANRQKVHAARNGRGPGAGRLDAGDAAADVAALRAVLEERYAYLRGRRIEWAPRALSRDAFAVELAKLLAPFGDGHTRIQVERHLPRAYLPFLVGVDGEDLIAIAPDRSRVLGVLRAIDGVPVARWLAAAQSILAHGSPQYRLWYGARNLRYLGFLRAELGLPLADTVRVAFEGGGTVAPPIARRKPVYGAWPRTTSRIVDGVGCLRIARMDRQDVRAVRAAMRRFEETKGLVIDVRGNGGGTRDILRALLPYFLDAPRVVNAAKARLGEDEENPQGHLDDRFLFPRAWTGWTGAERAAIDAFARDFRPAWEPGAGFSAWHYMVVSPGAERYREPVVVLMDPFCFSATDVFLGAFKGVKGVTLMGLPSGGGSGRARTYRLPHCGLEIRVSSMASFQPNGHPYNAVGVQPDVEAAPTPTDWTTASDTVLVSGTERARGSR